MCVVLGVDETRTFCGLSALVGCKGFCRVTSVFVFGFVLFVACCWVSRAARVLFYGSPLVGKAFLLVAAHVFGLCLVGCCVWGGVLCENCIVDANAIKIATIIVLLLFVFSFLWFCSWYFLLSVREKICVCFLF